VPVPPQVNSAKVGHPVQETKMALKVEPMFWPQVIVPWKAKHPVVIGLVPITAADSTQAMERII
jgi:hypothetical protein